MELYKHMSELKHKHSLEPTRMLERMRNCKKFEPEHKHKMEPELHKLEPEHKHKMEPELHKLELERNLEHTRKYYKLERMHKRAGPEWAKNVCCKWKW